MRWAALFASLLLAVTAAPLIEASPARGSEEPPAEGPPAPDFAEIEREELEHAEWLLSPEAKSQREASRTAYTDLSAGEAQGLLLEAFPAQLKQLNADPARFLSELEIEEPLGTYGARVSAGEGESALLESAVPVESDLGGGGKEPVDLTLEETGGDFVPQNPLTEVELPRAAEEPIQLQGGVEVALPASDDHPAEPLGDKNLFYPETGTATDTLVAPRAAGVEIFEQLRSPESPERLSFALSLPAGASLQAREDGGAEVVSASEEIEEVSPPSAVDAQGVEVPVTMSVEGDSLLLEVPHGSREVAYPVLVDPEFLTDSPSFVSKEWFPVATADYTLTNLESSLSAVSKGHVKYGAETYGQWIYTAPGETTYIEEAAFSSIYYFLNNCSTAQPHGYTGISKIGAKTFQGKIYSNSSGAGYTASYSTGKVGGQGYRYATLGVGAGATSVEIGCAHELYVGGVTALENDPEAPTINSVSGIPSGWFDPTKAGSATITATDPGVGLEYISIGDGEVTNTDLQHCSGLSGSRCPRQLTWKVNPPYVKGESTLKVSAEDALASSGHVTNWSTPTKVDTTAPAIDLSGQFAEATDEEGLKGSENKASENQLPLPVYNLAIKATDGNEKGTAKERQSGVKNIEVFLDGSKQEVAWKAQSCAQEQSSCKMEETYSVKLVGLSAKKHKLKVIATDQVGIAGEREIAFEYVPATGIKDDYVLQHFPLPDGEGGESEEDEGKQPELAVNVVNGNLVYHQRDVEVPGAAVDLELERFYNSQLPKEESSEWGEGWTLAQTPKLEPEEAKEAAPPTKASMLRTSGILARSVALPTEPLTTRFDSKLGATVTRESGGGYEVADQSGKTANSLAFDASGRLTELRTPGYARVEYGYENGNLSEVAVRDPTVLAAESVEGKQGGGGGFETPAYFGAIGGEGSGAGRLSGPAGVATDSQGNVWVADTAHNRIQEFNPKGEFVNQFGAGGSGNGTFREPRGVAIDSKGNVWVADTGNYRVQEFDSSGKFIRQFGGQGTGNSQFSSLRGVAIDPEGHVWTVDAAPGGVPRVREFSAEGAYIAKFGVKGSENGQLKEPKGIATDSKGNVWVADTANNRIEEFNPKGEYIRKFGGEGAGNGQLKSPTGLTIDSEGNVWVADTVNNRVQEFSAEGAYLSQFGAGGNGSGQFSEPRGIAVDSKGNVWVADTGNDRIQESTAGGFVRKFGGEGSEAGQLSAPGGVATDAKGNVWVADTGHNRVQEFDPSGKFLAEFGAKGSANGLLLEPHGIAVDAEGNVWVADTGNCRIEEFNSKGEFIRKVGVKGAGNGNFVSVWGVAVDPEGHVWTIDAAESASRAQEFTAKGEYIRKFGSNATLTHPKGIAADAKGNVWITDYKHVKEFTVEGKSIREFGGEGAGNGQLSTPVGLTVDSEGNVWVADTGNDRIQEFSPEGSYLSQFGIAGNDDGQFSEPQDVAVDSKGNVWVADAANNRIQESAAGEFVRKFGGEGSGAGQLKYPSGVATDSEGNAWVTDSRHNRVQKFNSNGEFIFQFGSSAPGNGNFSTPESIAVAPNGNVWVADNEKVQEFNSKGEFVGRFLESGEVGRTEGLAVGPDGNLWAIHGGCQPCVQELSPEGKVLTQFGSEGSAEGQLSEPQAIAVDPSGNIWIADPRNFGVEEFNPKGEFIRKVSSEGVSLATDSEGNVWVADTRNDQVKVYSAKGILLGQFGGAGNNEGQFDEPHGLTVDTDGSVWVADSANDRVQRWQVPRYVLKHSSLYLSSVAGSGSAGGQLEHPGDVALDSEGNVWVADEQNDRVEEFDEEGEFLEAFGRRVNRSAVEAGGSESERNLCTAASEDTCEAGEAGAGAGLLNRPASLAIDADGNIVVADAGNNRIETFAPDGKYLSQFGSAGSGTSQFHEPEGVAIDPHGNIWVSDTYNGRLQEFDEAGEFIRTVGSFGSGPGHMGEPTGIDIGPWGHVWVADWLENRVEEFDSSGKFIRQFGIEGTAKDQFHRPDGLTITDRGQLWVADESDRVQAFTEKGEYVGQFGAKGSGEGQLELGYPIGMATDSKGNLWIADSGNDRVQRWGVYDYANADEPPTVEDAPQVEIQESGEGLVESVEGKEAGQIGYAHKGEMLTAVDAPQGETAYEYDSAERLTKVTLPNGTWGQVQYDSIGRVKAVTVSIEGGKAKTTHFEYAKEIRRTAVEPEGEETTFYDIGEDGSVFKWWNVATPPTIEELTGSLYAQRGEVHPEPISGGDQTLVVPAFSTAGIASIQIVANGDQLVTEKTCEQTSEPGTECEHESLSWVTETENWAPGTLQLEAIATDSHGQVSSERFWDNIPYTPPPDPEVPEPPKFSEVKHFREEYGLDLDLKGNEQAINERIFQLISDWHDPTTPQGEVARATQEKWGVPLRAADAAELEYRESYIAYDDPIISHWGEANAPSTYAGYYVDHRAGGLIYVGFTQNQAAQVEALKGQLMASDRIREFSVEPKHSLAILRSMQAEINDITQLSSQISGLWVDNGPNLLVVNTTNPALAKELLSAKYGSAIRIQETAPPATLPTAKFGRYGGPGRVQAGDSIEGGRFGCTAGFGAWDEQPNKKPNEETIHIPFLLTAGHCFPKNLRVFRYGEKAEEIGEVTRKKYSDAPLPSVTLDAEAIRTKWDLVPKYIYISHSQQKAIKHYTTPLPGQIVCATGATTNKHECGPVLGEPRDQRSKAEDGGIIHNIQIPVGINVSRGDSGGPVWIMGTGEAVGLITAAAGDEFGYPSCGPRPEESYVCPIVGVTPIQEILGGSASLYNAQKLSEEGLPEVPPLPVKGIVTNGG